MGYLSVAFIKLTRLSLSPHTMQLTFDGILVSGIYKADQIVVASTH